MGAGRHKAFGFTAELVARSRAEMMLHSLRCVSTATSFRPCSAKLSLSKNEPQKNRMSQQLGEQPDHLFTNVFMHLAQNELHAPYDLVALSLQQLQMKPVQQVFTQACSIQGPTLALA